MARRKKKKLAGPEVLEDIKVRDWLAVHAHFRSGAGTHGDGRKEASRKACRGRHNDSDS